VKSGSRRLELGERWERGQPDGWNVAPLSTSNAARASQYCGLTDLRSREEEPWRSLTGCLLLGKY
jgi:hypothetical protein